jgi:hypothetical protein
MVLWNGGVAGYTANEGRKDGFYNNLKYNHL